MTDADESAAHYDGEAHEWTVPDGEERYLAWQAYHDEHCSDPHYAEPWEYRGPSVITVDASPYL